MLSVGNPRRFGSDRDKLGLAELGCCWAELDPASRPDWIASIGLDWAAGHRLGRETKEKGRGSSGYAVALNPRRSRGAAGGYEGRIGRAKGISGVGLARVRESNELRELRRSREREAWSELRERVRPERESWGVELREYADRSGAKGERGENECQHPILVHRLQMGKIVILPPVMEATPVNGQNGVRQPSPVLQQPSPVQQRSSPAQSAPSSAQSSSGPFASEQPARSNSPVRPTRPIPAQSSPAARSVRHFFYLQNHPSTFRTR
ncbi:hypothetical protein CRG98_041734 [Punica granatum]|uniref:Uncharacterized protein n=1 Tax=Punica granatum TaxID=22663 RepID=A0A2I0I222_PUNGR|nr:hypothetical protein CRG98_041734 [Punica granatum]